MSSEESSAALERLAISYLKEQRRRRFWSILFRSLFLLIIVGFIILSIPNSRNSFSLEHPHAALIELIGTIQEKESASADNVATSLSHAFHNKGVQGIILRINSPGGSPVQADYIYSEIKRWKSLRPSIPIYAVCSDICASAAYYIAAASDKIYANQSSLIGSIGVIYHGFGFQRLIQKVGVESRLQTAGSRKAMLNPFQEMNEIDKIHLQKTLDSVHRRFIQRVKSGRGQRLVNDSDLFSGLFWGGEEAKKLGLIDDFSSTGRVAREVIQVNRLVDYTIKPNIYEKLTRQLGVQFKMMIHSLVEYYGLTF